MDLFTLTVILAILISVRISLSVFIEDRYNAHKVAVLLLEILGNLNSVPSNLKLYEEVCLLKEASKESFFRGLWLLKNKGYIRDIQKEFFGCSLHQLASHQSGLSLLKEVSADKFKDGVPGRNVISLVEDSGFTGYGSLWILTDEGKSRSRKIKQLPNGYFKSYRAMLLIS